MSCAPSCLRANRKTATRRFARKLGATLGIPSGSRNPRQHHWKRPFLQPCIGSSVLARKRNSTATLNKLGIFEFEFESRVIRIGIGISILAMLVTYPDKIPAQGADFLCDAINASAMREDNSSQPS